MFAPIRLGATSTSPDTDENNLNNDFNHAEYIGIADPGSGNTKPPPLKGSGELGNVLGGYDSKDVYSFDVNDTFIELTFRSVETPTFTSYVSIHNSGRKLKFYSRGNAGEDFVLTLPPDRYFITLETSRDVVGDRTAKYSFTLSARRIPAPDSGGSNCQNATPIDAIAATPQVITGSIEVSRSFSAYRLHLVEGGRLFVDLVSSRQLAISLSSPVSGGLPTLTPHTPPVTGNGTSGSLLLDPGVYCLVVHQPSCPPAIGLCIDPSMQPSNYQLRLSANLLGPKGAPSRSEAYQIPLLDLDPLIPNGGYKKWRHLYGDPDYDKNGRPPSPLLKGNHRMREWMDNSVRNMFVKFVVGEPGTHSFNVSNMIEPIRAVLEDANGSVVSELSASGFRFDTLPRNLRRKLELQPGTYFLHLFSDHIFRIGTSVQIDMD